MKDARSHSVFNLIILDESGSMESIKEPTISGFNEVVQTIKAIEKMHPEQEHFISLVSFNGTGIKTLLDKAKAADLLEIDGNSYRPDANTPLYDAIGFSCNALRGYLANRKDYNVLVTILTDGEENASKEYTGQAISALVENLKKEGWTFTYMGANHDVERAAATISVTNTISFVASAPGMKSTFEKEKKARMRFSTKLSKGASMDQLAEEYYKED